jgi:hypothetical protein
MAVGAAAVEVAVAREVENVAAEDVVVVATRAVAVAPGRVDKEARLVALGRSSSSTRTTRHALAALLLIPRKPLQRLYR